jgi:hypothetical protein
MQLVRRLRLFTLFSIGLKSYSFTDYFRGMENVEAVKQIFGEKTEEVLKNLRVDFIWFVGYMGVNDFNGHIMISAKYLRQGDKTDIYLDLIHELVHVRQFMESKELFDVRYTYTERPTEIEAYRAAVKEARRVGLNDERICRYLKTEWMNDEDLKRLAKALNVTCTQQ